MKKIKLALGNKNTTQSNSQNIGPVHFVRLITFKLLLHPLQHGFFEHDYILNNADYIAGIVHSHRPDTEYL